MDDKSYAQFGEDLIIRELFDRIGAVNRWCFEVGAHDGVTNSNTLIFRRDGWSAVLAESDAALFAKLNETTKSEPKSYAVWETVTDLDSLLARHNAPTNLDLGVIDIDGDDYWLWHGMTKYRPRVLLVEYSPYVKSAGFDPDNPIPRGENKGRQTARQPTLDLAADKGYTLVAETFCNLLFVQG